MIKYRMLTDIRKREIYKKDLISKVWWLYVVEKLVFDIRKIAAFITTSAWS